MAAAKSKRKTPAPVVYVTGKGGAGKTFVADALAAAAAARGFRTCIVSPPSTASRIETDDETENVERIRYTPAEALGRLLVQTVRFRFIANRLMDSSTFSAVADAAPGIADIAFLSLLDEISKDRSKEAAYDLIVVDAPASGHSATLLKAPEYIGRIAAFGPAATVVARTKELVSKPARFRPLIVCPPEELAVLETTSLLAGMREDKIAEPVVVANSTYPTPGNEPQLRWLREHAAGKDAEIYIGRLDRQNELLDRLRTVAPALCEIPRSFPVGSKGRELDDFESPDAAVERLLDRLLESRKARRNSAKKTQNKTPDKTPRKAKPRARRDSKAAKRAERPA